jgi:hypothetical protein
MHCLGYRLHHELYSAFKIPRPIFLNSFVADVLYVYLSRTRHARYMHTRHASLLLPRPVIRAVNPQLSIRSAYLAADQKL